TDADHVVAVTTFVSRQRNARAAALIGAFWGLGHTATILLVGGVIVLFGIAVPAQVGLSMEFAVALMLVVLGTMNLKRTVSAIEDVAPPKHTALETTQPSLSGYLRPIVVGAVHGLAGSAAVALLVLTTIRDADWAMIYLGLFGLGTTAGMVLLTLLMSVPLSWVTARFAGSSRFLARTTGLVSVLFGLFLVYQIGFVDGLIVPN
ncbi:MAG TPA: high-affinity nickel-transport family protein, partial [Polyangiaceae bacterium]|nr:high-affinity nickel-transport family protein [Polyangiaceae bacterium]